jgi:cation transport ATPase
MERKEVKEEVEKEKLLKESEIALWLDTYDDIFSDFDPRQFSQRAVSIDFLDEIKRASRDKVSGQLELRFLIPKDLRKEDEEAQIKKRLRDHFKRHQEELAKDNKKSLINAVSFIVTGFAMLILAAYISSLEKSGFIYAALVVFLEPAGWFTFWFSLEQLFEHFKEKKPEMEFYEKMSKADISFISY